MTKLITVTGRSGAGKTTVAAILAEKLAEKYCVCLIDNNRNNINIYSATSSIENINLYSYLPDKATYCRAIKESASKIKKNLYFFSGSRELLAEEQIQLLKEQNIFEYIVLNSESMINSELSDYDISVINQNKFEYEMAATSEKNMIVINRYTENAEFKANQKDFKLYFCAEINNFTNGFELTLSEENEKEVNRIIERITGDKSQVKAKKKFKLFGRR
jgi:adenylate kinase family enzyme